MTNLTYERINAKKEELEKNYEKICKSDDYYLIFIATSELGRFLSTIDSFLMTDKIDLDEYTDYYSYYSQMGSKILKVALDLDHIKYNERRKKRCDKQVNTLWMKC